MRIRSTTVIRATGLVVALAVIAGCSANHAAATGQPTSAVAIGQPTSAATPAALPTATASPTSDVKNLAPGNCTMFAKADAVTLIGSVNGTNKALDIGTDGGTKIDVCSYLDLKGGTDIQGISYAVVRFDSDTTAFSEAQKVQTEMLSSASANNWPVQSLTTAVQGAGTVLGGYGTKTDEGVTFTIAVVGTNVGPYLVAALGASTESADNAKKFALTLFQALATATS